MALLDKGNSCAEVVEYHYDAWSGQIGCTGSMAATLGMEQPFRYRAYVYDEETGLYYLRSRYYNPVWGRFVNADSVLTKNLFACCTSIPVMRVDPDGFKDDLPEDAYYWNPAGTAGLQKAIKQGEIKRRSDLAKDRINSTVGYEHATGHGTFSEEHSSGYITDAEADAKSKTVEVLVGATGALAGYAMPTPSALAKIPESVAAVISTVSGMTVSWWFIEPAITKPLEVRPGQYEYSRYTWDENGSISIYEFRDYPGGYNELWVTRFNMWWGASPSQKIWSTTYD